MIDQLVIGIVGPTAVIVSQSQKLKRYACLLGILTQPFWFYTSFVNEQWGIFAATFFYTGGWMLGIYNYWIKKKA